MENFQVSGLPVERCWGACGFPPESLIVVEPDVCAGKASVGGGEGQDHLAVRNPAVNPQNDIPNFSAWGTLRDDQVLMFQHELPRELIFPE